MHRTRHFLVALIVVGVVAWLIGGCGGSGSELQSVEPMALSQARAPVVADTTGLAKVIIGFKQQPGRSERGLVEGQGGKVKYAYSIIPAIAATIPQQAVDALQRNPNVAYVEGDGQVQALEDELVWGADRIDAEIAWGGAENAVDTDPERPTGLGVNVAIIDTGIDDTHSDLDANYAGGQSFVDYTTDPMDDNGHGTHCAGIVAAEDDGAGIIQVAPKASLYALKVLDATGSGYWSDVIAALEWCADEQNGIHVASMSLGGGGSEALKDACDAAYEAGVLLVASAGNNGTSPGRSNKSTVGAPAMYDSVIAVAATDQSDNRASFSSTGPQVELAAPGVGILSTIPGGSYDEKSGTSMACPYVSGVAALVIESGTSSASAVRDQMNSTAEDLGDPGRDTYYGYGLVDAEAATDTTPPPADTTPPSVTITSPLNSATVSGTITITAQATDDVGLASVEYQIDTGGWISMGNTSGDTYAAAWDSTSVTNGGYTITARATDTSGNSATDSVSVTVENGTDPEPGPGAVAGKVTDGKGIRGAMVKVEPSGPSATANPAGRYKIEEVPTGAHQVTASAAGYADLTKSVTVSEGQTTTVNFALTPSE